MYINHVIFLLFTSPVFSQYGYNPELRPDVTFGDHNDRFDVSSIIDYQNRFFRADDSIDYRRKHTPKSAKSKQNLRSGLGLNFNGIMNSALFSRKGRKKLAKKIKKDTQRQVNEIANQILLRMNSARRTGYDYILNDKQSDEDDIQVFDKSLRKFRNKPSRRSGVPYRKSRRIAVPELFNYAFPIDMNIQGYLLTPENQK